MASKQLAAIVGILLLGAVLRFHALGQDVRFHPDEALFVTFARQAAVQGDWLLHGVLDKPPLTIYVNAVALTAFGITVLPNGVLTLDSHAGEFAARVPGVFASLLLMAVVYALAKRLYLVGRKDGGQFGSLTPYLAALLVGLSPLAVAFSATAFTDGLMLLCVVIALWLGSLRKWMWGGIWLALGIWCKQQVLLYVPLVVVVAYVAERGAGYTVSVSKVVRFVVPIVVGLGMLFVWDGARTQDTSLWALATVNNDPGRLVRIDELIPRLQEWWHFGQFILGGSFVTLLVMGLLVIGWVRVWRENWGQPKWIDGVLAGYVIVYLLIHWLVAINIYDRYLLLILPPSLLLFAKGIDGLLCRFKDAKMQIGIIGIVVVIGLPAAWAASEHQLPIGGDRGRHNGIEAVADYLNQQSLGAIVYDHWLGWELGYYMGTWSDKRRVYYPNPEVFVSDALLQLERAPRYFVVPDWADATDWLLSLRNAKFEVRETYHRTPFAVYELLRPN